MKETCDKLVSLDLCRTTSGKLRQHMLPGESVSTTSVSGPVKPADIISPSQDRVRPVCPVYARCGGCDGLHMTYEAQLAFKDAFVRKTFEGLIDKSRIRPIIGNPEPFNYRHKAVLSASTVGKKLRLGLYAKNSRTVVPYGDCHLHDKAANMIHKTAEELLNAYKIPAYDPIKRNGIIKHVMVRTSKATAEALVILVTRGDLLPNGKKIASSLHQAHPMIKGVVQNIHRKNTHLVLLEEERVLYGRPRIRETIGDLVFSLSPRSFFQVNPLQMERLYQVAVDAAGFKGDETVVDCYSGIGTLSLIAARRAREVIGIEVNRDAHLDAVKNMKENNIGNVRFINGDVGEAIRTMNHKVDVLMMDPTREGADTSFLETVLKLEPARIVYVSCDPVTQARDVRILGSKYDVMSLQAVDMFSQTNHVESITLLSLKTA
jgi:23S rRNA (uracil1939-C5)-methyltransferase